MPNIASRTVAPRSGGLMSRRVRRMRLNWTTISRPLGAPTASSNAIRAVT